MTSEKYIQYLQSPETLNKKTIPELKELIVKYPFCQTSQILLTLNLLQINSNEFENQLSVTAACIPNRKILKKLINTFSIPNVKKEKDSQSFTDDKTIDAIVANQFENVGETIESNKNDEKELMIDKFIKGKPKINTPLPGKELLPDNEKNSLVENDDIVSETLAMVYEKQGYYKKAIKIYEKLSLENPEKSSSFASRIKKLKKSSNQQ